MNTDYRQAIETTNESAWIEFSGATGVKTSISVNHAQHVVRLT